MPEAATVSVMPSPLVLTTPLSFTTSVCVAPVPVELARRADRSAGATRHADAAAAVAGPRAARERDRREHRSECGQHSKHAGKRGEREREQATRMT